MINEGMASLSKKQVLIDEALEQSYEIALGGGTFGNCLVNFIYFFHSSSQKNAPFVCLSNMAHCGVGHFFYVSPYFILFFTFIL